MIITRLLYFVGIEREIFVSNILEQLSFENTENYQRYLERMTKSIVHSSKGYIPIFTDGCTRILDVGCGSGVLMKVLHERNPEAELYGIDLNSQAIDICDKKYPEFEFNACSLSDLVELVSKGVVRPFDCIIFSSVLHEFSSYDENFSYSPLPIFNAISDAYSCLIKGGKLLIRDGLMSENMSEIRVNLKNADDIQYVEKFVNEYHDGKKVNVLYEKDGTEFKMPWKYLKEFFFKFTWGSESWNREIKEQFGILTLDNWKKVVRDNNFVIKNCMTNAEEYLKYTLEKVDFLDGIPYDLFSEMTVLICAEKG